MIQGQRLNLKWTVADTDLVRHLARQGLTAEEICKAVDCPRLMPAPSEIVDMMHDVGVFVRRDRPRYGR